MKFVVKLFAIVSFAFLLSACGGSSEDNPADVAQTFFSELLEGDVSKAMPLLDMSEMNAAMAQVSGQETSDEEVEKKMTMMFTEMQKEVQNVGGVESITTGEVTYNDDKTEATVPVTLTFKGEMDGKTSDSQDISLKKIDGQWKVLLK